MNTAVKIVAICIAACAIGFSLGEATRTSPILSTPTPTITATPTPTPTATPTPVPTATALPTATPKAGVKSTPVPTPVPKATAKPISFQPGVPLVSTAISWNGVRPSVPSWLESYYKGSISDPAGFKGLPTLADGTTDDVLAREVCVYAAQTNDLSVVKDCGPYYQAMIRDVTIVSY